MTTTTQTTTQTATTTVTLDYQATLALYQYLTSTHAPSELIAPVEDALNRYELGDDYDPTDNEVLGLCEDDEDEDMIDINIGDDDDTDVPSATMSTAELIESIKATADYAREFEQQWGIEDDITEEWDQDWHNEQSARLTTLVSKFKSLKAKYQ